MSYLGRGIMTCCLTSILFSWAASSPLPVMMCTSRGPHVATHCSSHADTCPGTWDTSPRVTRLLSRGAASILVQGEGRW